MCLIVFDLKPSEQHAISLLRRLALKCVQEYSRKGPEMSKIWTIWMDFEGCYLVILC